MSTPFGHKSATRFAGTATAVPQRAYPKARAPAWRESGGGARCAGRGSASDVLLY